MSMQKAPTIRGVLRPLNTPHSTNQLKVVSITSTPKREAKPGSTRRTARRKPKSAYMTLEAQTKYHYIYRRLHAQDVANVLGVDIRTVYKWISGKQSPDPLHMELLRIKVLGIMPWDGWEDFHVDTEVGRIRCPNLYLAYPGDLEAIGLYRQQIKALEFSKAKLQAEVDTLKDRLSEKPKAKVIKL